MLKEIEIQNFRCFEQIKISGFERVNLIGGKNNAGKTALLEALCLKIDPSIRSLAILKELRREKETSSIPATMLYRAWDNLFYNKNNEVNIVIISKDDSDNTEFVKINLDINSISIKSKIIVELIKNEDSSTSQAELTFMSQLISTGISLTEEGPIVPSFIISSGRKLTEAFDRARLDDKDSEVLKAFQVIDPAIESVESFSIGEPTLYLRRKGEKRLPLSLFGDAMNRVAHIMIKMINSKYNILLIDEIENGIHHTNQREFWRILFRLAVELDTKIFATTHSLEMLQAFADVGLEPNQKCSSAYFELARKLKTNQIIGSRLDLETLNYALEHKEGVRGE
ncbi:AAA family ATPase [Microcoleus sp. LEGE 07076]|uniref:AAA family ATPase n=1 Tax=Microcoleus sp. LEGE 07076 TaxID=915322 RepID=UPI001881F806|nr:AAA family ATPase [Microcoleus sp. LEGE 07076]MBE9184155.1 AAA family ATPase [Microcoleus sp. LEGE 07076]